MPIRKYPTLVGYSALVFWALAAPFVVKIKSLPIFETLTIVFSISFLLSAIKLTLYKQWSTLKQPWYLWIIGFVGIYGNDLLYIGAFKNAPAAHADLINYLWPILVILFVSLFSTEKVSIRHLVAAFLGLAGIYILICHNEYGFQSRFIFGYFLAFLDAVVWSIYTLAARYCGKTPVEIIGVYCGWGAICSLLFHLQWETSILPTWEQGTILVVMGVTTQSLAYFFWDYGVKRGDFKLLTVLSYANPILSILFLILFGMAKPSIELLIACVLVSSGGLICIVRAPKKKLEPEVIIKKPIALPVKN